MSEPSASFESDRPLLTHLPPSPEKSPSPTSSQQHVLIPLPSGMDEEEANTVLERYQRRRNFARFKVCRHLTKISRVVSTPFEAYRNNQTWRGPIKPLAVMLLLFPLSISVIGMAASRITDNTDNMRGHIVAVVAGVLSSIENLAHILLFTKDKLPHWWSLLVSAVLYVLWSVANYLMISMPREKVDTGIFAVGIVIMVGYLANMGMNLVGMARGKRERVMLA